MSQSWYANGDGRKEVISGDGARDLVRVWRLGAAAAGGTGVVSWTDAFNVALALVLMQWSVGQLIQTDCLIQVQWPLCASRHSWLVQFAILGLSMARVNLFICDLVLF